MAGAFLLAWASVAGGATPETIDGPAELSAPAALRVPAPRPDVVTLRVISSMDAGTQTAAHAAAVDAGASSAVSRSGAVPMRAIRRGTAVVQAAASSFHYTMGVTVVGFDAAAATMSWRVYETLARGEVVLSDLSASMRGARAGDTVEFQKLGGGYVTMRIGLIASESEVRGAEFVMAPAQADAIGFKQINRVVIWAPRTQAAIEASLKARGLIRNDVIVGRSWTPMSPDETLGLARNKQLAGEFSYRLYTSGSVSVDAAWATAYVNNGTRTTFADIPIRAACNKVARPHLQSALTEIRQAGLAGGIDVANTNSYGGCFYARFIRGSANSFGSLSRHSWGAALDTNTVTNAQGAVPKMDCRIVRILRKWGFAWGGNFTNPDGMHFEYVGERRDQIIYPSKYCPNVAPPAATVAAAPSPLSVLSANAGAVPPPPPPTPADGQLFGNDGLAEPEG